MLDHFKRELATSIVLGRLPKSISLPMVSYCTSRLAFIPNLHQHKTLCACTRYRRPINDGGIVASRGSAGALTLSPCCYRVTAVAIKLRDRSPVSTFVHQENGNGENATLSPLPLSILFKPRFLAVKRTWHPTPPPGRLIKSRSCLGEHLALIMAAELQNPDSSPAGNKALAV